MSNGNLPACSEAGGAPSSEAGAADSNPDCPGPKGNREFTSYTYFFLTRLWMATVVELLPNLSPTAPALKVSSLLILLLLNETRDGGWFHGGGSIA